MKKLSFFKGLFIGSLFSAVIWVGIIGFVSILFDNETPQEQMETMPKDSAPIAALKSDFN